MNARYGANMRKLYLDTETFSDLDLLRVGGYRYAERAEIMLLPFAIDDAPIELLDLTAGDTIPDLFFEAVLDDSVEVIAHNAMFDRTALRLGNLGIDIPIHRWHCTMARALAHSLPGSLDALGKIFGLPEDARKLESGSKLIHLFCKPRPYKMKIDRATRLTHPAEWEEFKRYAVLDVEAMRMLDKRMPRWNYQGEELALWHLDQQINDRGIYIDMGLVEAAIRTVQEEQESLRAQTDVLTGGEVASATKRDALLKHILAEYGVDLPDMKSSTIERRIDDENMPWALRELLSVRLQATTSSTAKYGALQRWTASDDRIRGCTQFDGASRTGRDAHRGFQPGNLPRPTLPADEVEAGIELIKHGGVSAMFDNTMALCSSALRGTIIAPPGKKLVVADLAAIEGRVAAWLAGEDWVLDAFSAQDVRLGPDLYIVTYAKAFGINPNELTKKDPRRQIGKVLMLLLGYGGGVGAFVTGALAYNIDLDEMADAAWPTIPKHIREEAEGFYEWTLRKRRSTFGLSKKAFCTCDALKRLWRESNPNIVSYWAELQQAFVTSMYKPGIEIECRKVAFLREKAWLKVRLPSGRYLCYPSPERGENDQLSYLGVNNYTRKWSRIKTYGGKLLENITQAVSRDVMFYSQPGVEAAGYEIVLKVHDELLTEAPDSPEFNAEHLAVLMTAGYDWSYGLPLAAAGFEAKRYKKD